MDSSSVIMTADLHFVERYFFLTVNISKLKIFNLIIFFISCKLSQKMFTEYILFNFAQEAFNNKSVKRDFSLLAQLLPYSGFSQFTEVRISPKLSWITRTGLAICLILSRVLELLWHFFVWAHRHKGDPWILRLEMLACSFAFDRLKHKVRRYNFFLKCWLSIIIIKTRRVHHNFKLPFIRRAVQKKQVSLWILSNILIHFENFIKSNVEIQV